MTVVIAIFQIKAEFVYGRHRLNSTCTTSQATGNICKERTEAKTLESVLAATAIVRVHSEKNKTKQHCDVAAHILQTWPRHENYNLLILIHVLFISVPTRLTLFRTRRMGRVCHCGHVMTVWIKEEFKARQLVQPEYGLRVWLCYVSIIECRHLITFFYICILWIWILQVTDPDALLQGSTEQPTVEIYVVKDKDTSVHLNQADCRHLTEDILYSLWGSIGWYSCKM